MKEAFEHLNPSSPGPVEFPVLKPSIDWESASWVQAPLEARSLLFKRIFELSSPVQRASLSCCGLGLSEAYINGAKIDHSVLQPLQTCYEDSAFYQYSNVTEHLQAGANSIGVWTGPGWYDQDTVWGGLSYGKQGVIAILRVEYVDGSVQSISTDEDWLCAASAVTQSNIYLGESFDARRHEEHWASVEKSALDWVSVVKAAALSPRLVYSDCPPIRRIEERKAQSFSEPVPNVRVVDFGQNMAGWIKLQVEASAGAEVCLRFSESVYPDGSIDVLSAGVNYLHGIQTDRYICSGKGMEVWEPRFTYHGFRYVEVTARDVPLDSVKLTAVVVHNDLKPRGTFTSSERLLSRIFEMAAWTLRSNLHGIVSDCPTRERCGWLGDAHIVADFLNYQYEAESFLRKLMADIVASLGKADGTFDGCEVDARIPANIAPGKRYCLQARPDWGAAMIAIPYSAWLFSGKTEIVEQYSGAMEDWLAATWEGAREGLIPDGFGDWCPPGSITPVETAPELTSSILYFRALGQMLEIKRALGQTSSLAAFEARRECVAEAIHSKYFNGRGYGSQAANAMALANGLIPKSGVDTVLDELIEDIEITNRGHFNVGIFGMACLFEVLIDFRKADVAWRLLHQSSFPSFDYLIQQGATTFWEVIYDPEMHPHLLDRSKNHPMQAAFAKFFYSHIAGIRPDPKSPGFRSFILQPGLMEYIPKLSMSLATANGAIGSHWEHRDGQICWKFEIPRETRASIILPESLQVVGGSLIRDLSGVEPGCYSIQFRLSR